MSYVIEADRLGKEYILEGGASTTLRDAAGRLLNPFRRRNPAEEAELAAAREDRRFWALRDASFNVGHGEVVGFIGPNGAGKSTLLKILSRITWPTEGAVTVRGRVGSLLEVGTGFHPDLSGRDNVYLNGAILGMPRTEIRRRFDEIVAFAETERFIDVPVKRYSSGMFVRLAFAVAAHLESEVLIVDEVLAVGDTAFQKKCLGKIEEASRAGRTILFVSHNMGAVEALCNRCILIQDGRLTAQGAPRDVISTYLGVDWRPVGAWTREPTRPAAPVEFTAVRVTDRQDRVQGDFTSREPVRVSIDYRVRERLNRCQIAVRINNQTNVTVMTTAEADAQGVAAVPKEPGTYRAFFDLPAGLLAPDRYSLQVGAHDPMVRLFEVIDDAVSFAIGADGSLTEFEGRLGFITPVWPWTVVPSRAAVTA
jgi:lipopolysaccharide transport system ATP-binding protein